MIKMYTGLIDITFCAAVYTPVLLFSGNWFRIQRKDSEALSETIE